MLSSVLNTALSGLRTSQALLDTTTRNITNSGTEGYSKKVQQAKTIAQFGGVEAGAVKRVEDKYLSRQLRYVLSDQASEKYKVGFYSQINDYSGDPAEETSLPSKVNNLADQFQRLSSNPANIDLRGDVVRAADELASSIRGLYDNVTAKRLDIDDDVNNSVDQANELISRIAGINEKIAVTTLGGNDASDMLDRRDQLLSELSGIMKIEGFEDDKGIFHLYTGDHKLLATNKVVNELERSSSTTIEVDGHAVGVVGGQLGAALEGIAAIEAKKAELDEVAAKLALAFDDGNALTTTDVGIILFTDGGNTPFDPTNPLKNQLGFGGRITVNSDFVADTSKVQGTLNSGDPAIAVKARDALILNKTTFVSPGLAGSATFEGVTTSVISDIAGKAATAKNNYEDRSSVQQLLSKRLTDQNGVSTDEEMQKMIFYQNAYNSSARVIKVTQEMLDELMRMV